MAILESVQHNPTPTAPAGGSQPAPRDGATEEPGSDGLSEEEEEKQFRERMNEIKRRDPNVYPTF